MALSMDRHKDTSRNSSMHDVSAYRIEIQGSLSESEINAPSPVHLTLVHKDPTVTQFSVHADQSGVVGLIRHLHGRGLVLLSVYRER
jgi:hypothetical protein